MPGEIALTKPQKHRGYSVPMLHVRAVGTGSVDSPVTPPDAPGVDRGPTPETDFHSFAFRCVALEKGACLGNDPSCGLHSFRLKESNIISSPSDFVSCLAAVSPCGCR